jgi:GNAT superfamily N-acetyltransferase
VPPEGGNDRAGELTLRRALPADALAVAEVHVRAWQAAYRDQFDPEWLDALDPRERAARYDFAASGPDAFETVIAWEGDADGASGGASSFDADTPVAIAGFATFGPSRDADAPGRGEIVALYVDPGRWRGGAGRLLLAAANGRLRERGFAEAILWVLDGNDRAERFYADDGWSRDGAARWEQPYGVRSHVFRMRRRLDG